MNFTPVPKMTEACPRCGSAHAQEAKVCETCGFALRAASAEAFTPTERAGDRKETARAAVAEAAEAPAAAATPRPAPTPEAVAATAEAAGTPPPAAALAPAAGGPGLVGQMVGEYQVTGVIGEGGMGTVYSGVQPLIDKKVAIKVLKSSLSRSSTEMQRFLDEARAVNRIGHPNIIDVFSFGALPDGSQYFVMELLVGRSLQAYLGEKKIVPYGDAYQILPQVLDALEAAHHRQIIHRDLKPDNIFLAHRPGGGFTVKLLDFGIAKFTEEGMRSGRTRTGELMGTPLYMSPEQCHGRDIDRSSDVYSLGVILYQMFTGALPFTAESVYDMMTAHLEQVPTPPGALVRIPAELEAVILRCLAKDKHDRPATVAELRRELLPPLAELAETEGNRTPDRLRDGPLPASARTPRSSRPGLAATAPRRVWRWVAVAGGLVAVGALGAGLGLRRRPPPQQPAAVIAPRPRPDAGARTVLLQFMVTPATAKAEIWVDGRKLARPEIETPLSRERRLEVKVLAEGYQPYLAHPLPVSDLILPVTLAKVPLPPAKTPRRLRERVRTAPPQDAKPLPAPAKAPRVPRIEQL